MEIQERGIGMEWISCDERMPEYGVYLICHTDNYIVIASLLYKKWTGLDDGIEYYPTHWMPLPEPPKQK
jgi:hypothetical protein